MITQQPAQQSATKPMSQDNNSINDYQPPTKTVVPSTPTAPATVPITTPSTPTPTPTPSIPTPAPVPPKPTPAPTQTPMPSTPTKVSAKNNESESLQDQDIFYLLGVTDSSDDEKDEFLDELQQIIWEDFIETDTEALISAEEMSGLRQIMSKGDSQDNQEETAVYLEKLIPDLEELMLKKALELKGDMVLERVAGMRKYYADKPDSMVKIDEVEKLIKTDQWHHAAEVLNAIGE